NQPFIVSPNNTDTIIYDAIKPTSYPFGHTDSSFILDTAYVFVLQTLLSEYLNHKCDYLKNLA
ncbi:MAG: hypothetical protein ABS921_04695, partial [Psychrobacter alimentarius]